MQCYRTLVCRSVQNGSRSGSMYEKRRLSDLQDARFILAVIRLIRPGSIAIVSNPGRSLKGGWTGMLVEL